MARRRDDVKSLITSFVKSDFDEDLAFMEEQKLAGIKVCDQIFSEIENGKPSLKIVTQLSQSGTQSSDNIGHRNCGDQDNAGGTKTESEFFISSMEVSTNEQNNTSITTVVSKKDSALEAVYEANVVNQSSGTKLALHASYLRSSHRPTLTRSTSLNKNDAIVPVSTITEEPEPKPNQSLSKPRFSFKRLSFTDKPKSTQAEAKNFPRSQGEASTSASQQKPIKSKEKNDSNKLIDVAGVLPFKSFKIGADSGSFKSILSKNKERSQSVSQSGQAPPLKKLRSIKAEAKAADKTTTITTTIDNTTEPELYKAIISGPDTDKYATLPLMKESDSRRSMTKMHLDINPGIMKPSRKGSCPNMTCTCKDQRLDLVAKWLQCRIDGKNTIKVEEELMEFSDVTYHRHNCHFGEYDEMFSDILRSPRDKWTHSHNTLHRHCESCENFDMEISPFLRKSMESLVEDHDHDAEIKLSGNDLDILTKAKHYDIFHRQLIKSLGSTPNTDNFYRLLCLTRTIIRHIGNPNDAKNHQINTIYQFVVKFYHSQFYPHIEKHHKGLEDFIFNCHCDDFEDVY